MTLHSRRVSLAVLLAAAVCPQLVLAEEGHPLLSGIADFSIRSRSEKAFDAVTLDAGDISQASGKKYDGPLTFEGKVTRLTYANPASTRSRAEIFRNYKAAIGKLGGRQVNSPPAGDVSDWHVFRIEQAGKGPVSVLLNVPYESEYELVIVEQQAMAQTVQAGELAKEINSNGFATIYVNFDTNQSVLKQDGVVAVKEIALLMKQVPKLKLNIEGHTDNVGSPADNKKLSQARAEAVVKAVVGEGVDAKRLVAVGRGQESPVADNRNEAGRAKNRRVELVKQS